MWSDSAMTRVRQSEDRAEAVMTAPTLALEKVERRRPVLRSQRPIPLLVIVTAIPWTSHDSTDRISFSCLSRGWTSSRMVDRSHTLMVRSMDEVTAWFHLPSVREHIWIIRP